MASSPAPDRSPSPSPSPWPGAETVSEVEIRGYLEANIDRYAPEALTSALVAAGHDAGLVAAALEQALAVRSSRPARDRARRLITGAYGVTYVVFAVGLLTGPSFFGAGPILLGVLTVTLGGAFLVSRWWTGRRRAAPSLTGLLLLPVILLGLVGGACYATTGAPFGRLGQPTADTFGKPADNAPEQAPAIAPAYPAY